MARGTAGIASWTIQLWRASRGCTDPLHYSRKYGIRYVEQLVYSGIYRVMRLYQVFITYNRDIIYYLHLVGVKEFNNRSFASHGYVHCYKKTRL